MTTLALPARRAVLADLLPNRSLLREAALVGGGAVLIGVAAQVAIPLPFTPVPLTLQTLAVLLSGAALGPGRGLLSALLYLAAGCAGVPWFSAHSSGWSSPSFGYVVGFVLAAAVAGGFAQRGADRSVAHTAAVMALADLTIYLFGVPWLMASAHVSFGAALTLGVVPFLAGDGIKIAVAAAVLPATWRLIGRQPG